ncbi:MULTISPECIES: hypothetical protein [Sphingomonas]|uniref:hypothetical protein n=1 Tax=Sphingomonas TaxID=13687 RepID=UPI001269D7A3|nr:MULTISPECIES: hypothetical protein [Sphingomonas]
MTLRVFDRIRLENLQLYQDAVSASDHPRLNRAIGALVKKCLGAEPVRRPNGTIAMRYTKPADGHLIKAYTLLQPTEAISHE